MSQFNFRLGRLRQLRTHEFERARRELEGKCAICDALDAERRARSNALTHDSKAIRTRLTSGMRADVWHGEMARQAESKRDITALRAHQDEAEKAKSDQQVHTTKAWQRVRILERLESRARRRHERAERQREQRATDEAATTRWWRSR